MFWFIVALTLLVSQVMFVSGSGFPSGPSGEPCIMTMHGIECQGVGMMTREQQQQQVHKEFAGSGSNQARIRK